MNKKTIISLSPAWRHFYRAKVSTIGGLINQSTQLDKFFKQSVNPGNQITSVSIRCVRNRFLKNFEIIKLSTKEKL